VKFALVLLGALAALLPAPSPAGSPPVDLAAVPPPPPLANGTYAIVSGNSAVDGGYGYFLGATPSVQLYSPASPGTLEEQWAWNGSTLENLRVASGGGKINNGPFMADAGDGTVTMTAKGDKWTVTTAGVVRDTRTGKYLSIVSGKLAMSATPTAWTMTPPTPPPPPLSVSLSPASASVLCNAAPGTKVSTASTSGGNGNPVTYLISAGDTGDFAMSGADVVVGPNGVAAANCSTNQIVSVSATQ
jgi:hypothetical protein